MCTRHSFIVTRAGKVFDGFGMTHSHTTIREIAGLSAENDTVNAYEWQPPKGWPNAEWHDGLTKDTEVFELKSRHLSAMERHVRSIYPTMAEWNAPDVARDLPKTATKINGDLIIASGNVTALYLTEVGGYVYVREGATFTAPVLTKVGSSVVVWHGATFTAPALTDVGGPVIVWQGATFTAPVLTEVGGSTW